MAADRVVLVDFMHNAYACLAAKQLWYNAPNGDGTFTRVETTIPNNTIKKFWKMSGYGDYPIGIFFEGGNRFRKEYFSKKKDSTVKGDGYKGSRVKEQGKFYAGCNLTANILEASGCSVYRVDGYEADDCIFSMVRKIKEKYPDIKIDIITNDADLIPLVDDKVTVYKRGTRTFAKAGSPEHHLYFQVTPDTFDDWRESTSEYRNFMMPGGSLLLYKLIRGDSSDGIAASVSGYGAVKCNKLMNKMLADEVDFSVFRYTDSGFEPMRNVLKSYFKPEEIERMEFIYNGIKPRYIDLRFPKKMHVESIQDILYLNYGIKLKGSKYSPV